ncbi:MAG: hypothetical protein D6748_00425 [Calditrichaeota bacterium]|nr:MAG: hypothetical protein D6748_00425 [Calditrichota bacterium]
MIFGAIEVFYLLLFRINHQAIKKHYIDKQFPQLMVLSSGVELPYGNFLKILHFYTQGGWKNSFSLISSIKKDNFLLMLSDEYKTTSYQGL